jgi:hypothetical protein
MRGSGCYLGEFLRIDTDGDGPDVDDSAFVFDGVGHGRKIQDAITRREEMAGVIVCMETNVITRQHSLQNLTPNR